MAEESKMQSDDISSDLTKRLFSAIIMLPIAFIGIYFGGIVFALLALFAAIILSFEWQNMLNNDMLLDFEKRRRWNIFGFFLIFIPCASIVILRGLDEETFGVDGLEIVSILITIIITVDTAAYFIGKKFQGPKLAPKISPSKTWSGLIGGIGAASLVGLIISLFMNLPHKFGFVVICCTLAALEQSSDLFESMLKRKFGVKDSGTLIPGHGGLLDRIDGLILTAPITLLIIILTGGHGIFK